LRKGRIISPVGAVHPGKTMASSDPLVARWIRRQLEADPPRAPSLIVTIWGDSIAPDRGEVWLSTLFRLLAPFGINERAVRTGMFRLARSEWYEARPVGRRSRYRLTPAGTEGFERAFHRVYDPPFAAWSGDWEGLIAPAEAAGAAARKRLRDELAWAGYGRFASGVYLRPARRDGAADRIARSLRLNDAVTAFVARDVARTALPGPAARAEAVWSLAALAGEYRRFLARFGGVAAGFRDTDADPEQAFVVRTLLVHAYRRVRLRDPQLPREVLADDWPGAAAYELARGLYRVARPRADAFTADVFVEEGEPRASHPGRRARFATQA
jgi:phenylacetic acid degradation operon negative regulatory protein